ncbi:DUF6545 domain-containing protein [Actinophytocola xanthii]|uniref:DUF6545 domain-containing protein n=1 Tax=Actinophytocola xanthii TaxID=1912961 RepID=A0A1Q8CJY4_9PSEU|nr:DUF6545 domain-containing protein [Actinophytocola xanthii]OLF14675.1 hypothetical protein BU204_25630 [Actinophytocola xanthii]
MYEVMPHIALVLPRSRPARWQTVEFRLYRRIIEIRDAVLTLRPYVDEQVANTARESAAAAGLDRDGQEAVVEAATLAAALRAKADNRVNGDAAPPTAVRPADIDEEARWLTGVADAYRRSPVVAQFLR